MAEESTAIVRQLHHVLNHLEQNPYPVIPTPEGCKRRASVAVIIRVRPAYKPVPVANGSIEGSQKSESPPKTLDEFFAQEWVQEGDPEVLFIKRAGRKGDRWSGHVALPGGKRDPEDEDDMAAAIRESREEVGLELSGSECLQAGNLPQRVVATMTGEAMMVLCPYMFVLTGKRVQPALPQPTEVAGAHWVPLRALLSETLRTREYVDVSTRMAKQGGWFVQRLFRLIVGKMMFSAINLAPAQSFYASSIPGFIPKKGETLFQGLATGAFGVPSSTQGLTHQQPLLLWGLTLGVLADFLDMLPPYNAVKLWRYPTFTAPDLRILVWLFTKRLRRNNAGDVNTGTWPSQTAMDASTTATAMTHVEPSKLIQQHNRHNEVGIGGLGVGSNPNHGEGKMLAGNYYSRMNVAIAVFLVYRTVLGSAAAFWFYKLWRRRKFSL